MAVIQDATTEAVAAVDAANASPLHIVAKPQPYTVGGNPVYGHYQTTVTTGAMAAAARTDDEILQFRWTDTTRLCLIQRVQLTGFRATTAFAAGAIDFKMTRATAWTAAGTGGGTVTLTSPELKLRVSSMGASLVQEIRVATTAALGAGTKTLDTGNLGHVLTHSSAGYDIAAPIIGNELLPATDLFRANVADGEHWLVLEDNEGFVVRVTCPNTGVWNLGMSIRWCEAQYA